MKQRLNKIFEILWLVIIILCIIGTAHYYIKYDKWMKELLFMIPISIFFYIIRRRRGKNIKEDQGQSPHAE